MCLVCLVISTVNRKDSPAGFDEKQLIDVTVPQTRFEVHKVVLKGANLTGSFRLTLGDKLSRPLAPDAPASVVSPRLLCLQRMALPATLSFKAFLAARVRARPVLVD